MSLKSLSSLCSSGLSDRSEDRMNRWKTEMENFVNANATAFDLSHIDTNDKITVINCVIDALNTKFFNSAAMGPAFSLLRILTRTRTNLEPLFSSFFIGTLLRTAALLPSHDSVMIEALKLLFNLCILSQHDTTMSEIIEKNPDFYPLLSCLFTNRISRFERPIADKESGASAATTEDDEKKRSEEEHKDGSHGWKRTGIYKDIRTEKPSFEESLFAIRIILILNVQTNIANTMCNKFMLHHRIIDTLLSITYRPGDEHLYSSSNTSSSSSTDDSKNPSSTSSSAIDSILSESDRNARQAWVDITAPTPVAGERRKLAAECVKLLSNLLTITKEGNALQSHPYYDRMGERLTEILAYNVSLAPHVIHLDYHSDNEGSDDEASTSAAASTHHQEDVDSVSQSISSVKIEVMEDGKNEKKQKKPANEDLPPPERIKNDYIARIWYEAELDRKSQETAPQSISIHALKEDIANLSLCSDDYLATFISKSDLAIQAICNILHIQTMRSMYRRRDTKELLWPILHTCLNLAQHSPAIRPLMRRCIFRRWAEPPAGGIDVNKLGMAPHGAVSEKIFDRNPFSLRALMLKLITTLNYDLKQLVSEFLWQIANTDSTEYIRLTGFGNAVGLLAEKGLPGFGYMKENAISFDDVQQLLDQGKKL